jgi:hypothetical protein
MMLQKQGYAPALMSHWLRQNAQQFTSHKLDGSKTVQRKYPVIPPAVKIGQQITNKIFFVAWV